MGEEELLALALDGCPVCLAAHNVSAHVGQCAPSSSSSGDDDAAAGSGERTLRFKPTAPLKIFLSCAAHFHLMFISFSRRALTLAAPPDGHDRYQHVAFHIKHACA